VVVNAARTVVAARLAGLVRDRAGYLGIKRIAMR
jgi:hypothetical protein